LGGGVQAMAVGWGYEAHRAGRRAPYCAVRKGRWVLDFQVGEW
jgi:hypothetical protein